MFGPLKKFFSRQEAEAPAPPLQPPPAAPAPRAPARPAAPAPRPSAGAIPSDSAAPQPSASPAAIAASAPPPGSTTHTASETIKVPLKDICDRLPDNIKVKFIKLPTAGSTIPLLAKVVLSQLKQGAVRVPFKDVRSALPPGSFPDLAEFDHTLVDVPIAAVLPLLKPTDLYPKPSQRKLEVPAEIPGLFGPHGEPLSPPPSKKADARPLEKPAAATAAPAPSIKPATPAPIAPRPTAPAAGPSAAPIPGPSIPAPNIPAPNIPAPNLPPTNFPRPAAAAPKPAAPVSPPAPASAPIQMAGAPRPATPAAAPAAARSSTSLAASSAAVGNISIPVSAVMDSLPENVRGELSNHGSSAFTLPAEQIGQLLKTGRVMFPWKVLRASLRPTPPTEASAHDELPVEIPLKVVAPLFMTQGKPTFTQKKVSVGENIPDLFAGGPPGSKPDATAPAAAAASAAPAPSTTPAAAAPAPLTMASSAPAAAPAATRPSAPAAQPAATPAAAAQPAKAPADLAELFGQPGKKNWTPNEIVQKTGSLSGVSGALIAMQDGLLVASQLPGAMKGDTVAAFIPQIFGRMNQYTQELKLGELNHLTLSVDQVPWHFAKVGNVYFAAVGTKGESLPLPHLSLIASELARQNR